MHDLAGAVDKLPALVLAALEASAREAEIPLRMTGTDGGRRTSPGAVPGAVELGIGRHFAAPVGTLRIVGVREGDAADALENQAVGTHLHRPASVGRSGPSGIRTQNQGIMSPLL